MSATGRLIMVVGVFTVILAVGLLQYAMPGFNTQMDYQQGCFFASQPCQDGAGDE